DPPINHALEAFNAETLTDATVMRAILDVQSKAGADALEALDQARDELEEEKEVKEQLAAEAAEKKAEADAAVAELEAALAVQEQFAAVVEDRLSAKLAEAEALAAADAELSRQIAAEQAALAAALQASTAQPAAGSSTITPAPGGLATVSCPGGGSITVAGSIASNVQRLMNDAAAAGIRLCGGGRRRAVPPDRRRAGGTGRGAAGLDGPAGGRVVDDHAGPGRPRHRELPGRWLDHGRGVDRLERPAADERRRRRRHPAVRRRLPRRAAADRAAQGPLRHVVLRHLRDAVVAVQPADRPPRHVDARAGPRDRLHLQRRRDGELGRRVLPVAVGQRRPLRALRPAQRALALGDERQLTGGRTARAGTGARRPRPDPGRRARPGGGQSRVASDGLTNPSAMPTRDTRTATPLTRRDPARVCDIGLPLRPDRFPASGAPRSHR